MYQRIFHDRRTGLIHLWDDKAGYDCFKYNKYAYKIDPNGDHVTMTGLKVSRVTSWTKEDESEGLVFEHDVNPAMRVLIDQYSDSDDVSVGHTTLFFDIEVSKEKKYSKPQDAANPITAISYYDTNSQDYVCLLVNDHLTSKEVGHIKLKVFRTERGLLQYFLNEWERIDPSIVTGWNCVSASSYIMTKNKLVRISELCDNVDLYDGYANKVIYTGQKAEIHLKTYFGNILRCSAEHIVPAYIIPVGKYVNNISLKKYYNEVTVRDLMKYKNNSTILLKFPKLCNNNETLTYRQLILDNLDKFLSYDNFDVYVKSKDSVSYVKCHPELFTNISQNDLHGVYAGNKWRYKDLMHLPKDILVNYLSATDCVDFSFGTHQRVSLDISKPIHNDLFQLLGFIYTDGFFYKKSREYNFCNTNIDVIKWYSSLLVTHGIKRVDKFRLAKDNCYYVKFGCLNYFSLLYPLIYESDFHKNLNVKILSSISHEQFISFISGVVDGDGSVHKTSVSICNFENLHENNVHSFQLLLFRNGILNYSRQSGIHIPAFLGKNSEFLAALNLKHSKRKYLQDKIVCSNKKNRKNKQIGWFEDEDNFYASIKSIYDTNLLVDMYDINTTNGYFIANSVQVHNCDRFDIPYVFNRLKRVLSYDDAQRLSPVGIAYIENFAGEYSVKIAGVNCMDYMVLYKKFTYNEEPSYKLEAIAQKELGKGKIHYEGSLDDLYRSDIAKFIDYNVRDVELIVDLDKKLDFIAIAQGICHKGHVPYEDFPMSSRYLDGACLTYGRRNNIVIIGAGKREKRNADEAEGAFVKLPSAGLHRFVYDLDLESEYPNNIRTLNISPETKWGKILNWDSPAFAKGQNKKYSVKRYTNKSIPDAFSIDKEPSEYEIDSDEIREFLDSHNLSVSATGILYDTSKQGLLSALLTVWGDERKQYRKTAKEYHEAGNTEMYKFYDRKQLVQKILLNSLYGVLLLPTFRFYDLENGESITLTGQQLVQFSADAGNYYYNKEIQTDTYIDYCIYQDTDSCFFQALPMIHHRYGSGEHTDEFLVEKTLEIATEVQDYINKAYSSYAYKYHNVRNHTWHIKQEMVGKTAFWRDKKKRYAMHIINKNGLAVDEYEIKGFDSVRSDFPKSFRKFMRQTIIDILNDVPYDRMNERVADFQKECRNADIKEIMLPTSVKEISKFGYRQKGTPIHVKSAQNYNMMLELLKIESIPPIDDGEKIMWTYLRPNPYNFDTMAMIGYDDPEDIVDFINRFIDKDALFENRLLNKVQSIWDNLGWGQVILQVNDEYF